MPSAFFFWFGVFCLASSGVILLAAWLDQGDR